MNIKISHTERKLVKFSKNEKKISFYFAIVLLAVVGHVHFSNERSDQARDETIHVVTRTRKILFKKEKNSKKQLEEENGKERNKNHELNRFDFNFHFMFMK